jgi:two-component system sensor histidine kinase YesM
LNKVRIGLQGSMFLIFSLLSLLFVIISFSGFYFYMSNYLEKQATENLEQLTMKMSEQIDSFYSEMNHISLQILYTSELVEIMRQAGKSYDKENYFTQHTETERKVRDYLASFNGPDLTETRISLYNDRGDYVSIGTIAEKAEVIRSRLESNSFKLLSERFIEKKESVIFSGPHTDGWSEDQNQKLVSLYREFRDVSETYGLIEIQQSASKFQKILQGPNFGEVNVYVFDRDGQPAFMNQGKDPQSNISLKQLLGDQSTGVLSALDQGYLNQSDHLLTYRQTPKSQWTIVLIEPKSVLLAPIKLIGRLTISVSLSFIILSLIVNFVITRQLTKPYRKLLDSILHVSLDNLSIEIDDTSNEIILINRAFNSMFGRLKDSIEQVDHARSRELRARMNALESQMNPHFLYNVLTVIGAAGEQAGVDKVMDLCEKLSVMLRYTAKHQGREVTIRDELTYAQHYLDLMKERYEDHFQYRLELDEEMLSFTVPRLILQPLIENCFNHAFQNMVPPWIIHISIIQTIDYCWLFEVEDFGDGFDPIVMENLLRRIESNDKSNTGSISENGESQVNEGGLGLFNTLLRLKHTYGSQAFYEISNNDPAGTIVRIGVTRE